LRIDKATAADLQLVVPSFQPLNSQFYDLVEIFRIGGFAPDTNYLFLGAFFNKARRRS
jgi:hypothetical protein